MLKLNRWTEVLSSALGNFLSFLPPGDSMPSPMEQIIRNCRQGGSPLINKKSLTSVGGYLSISNKSMSVKNKRRLVTFSSGNQLHGIEIRNWSRDSYKCEAFLGGLGTNCPLRKQPI